MQWIKSINRGKREEGVGLGENKKLKEQVQKKVKKGYSVNEIADMLEEHVDVISKIIKEIEYEHY